MNKPIKAYVFIDTNIFLDFYRNPTDASLSLLEKLDGVKERVICTYQVEMEFLKNRQTEIVKIARNATLNLDLRLPAVLADTQLDAALRRQKQALSKSKSQLEKRIANLLRDPNRYDRISKVLTNIFQSNSHHVLTRDMPIRHKIKRLAWRRFILGYPPRKDKDTSIGDALNWEWLIHCSKELQGRIIIVSKDSDYGVEYKDEYFLNDALKAEFRDRVGRKSIIYTRKLSEALKHLKINVTDAEAESENISIQGSTAKLDLVTYAGSINISPEDDVR